jgi:hypothetical protein
MSAVPAAARAPAAPAAPISWKKDGWSVSLTLDGELISRADVRSDQSGMDQAFLTLLNTCLKGMTLRQARDHGVQQACLTHGEGRAAPVTGIVMPVNYSATSRAAAQALRTAIDSVSPPDTKNWNFDDNGLSDAWKKQPLEARRARLEALLADFEKDSGLSQAVAITDIDVYDRVFIQFKDDFPVAEKPVMLMRLERNVRKATGERIEFFVSEMKDNNRIRRL